MKKWLLNGRSSPNMDIVVCWYVVLMSGKANPPKSKSKKERKKRWQTTSPLFENGQLHANDVNTWERNSRQRKKMQVGQCFKNCKWLFFKSKIRLRHKYDFPSTRCAVWHATVAAFYGYAESASEPNGVWAPSSTSPSISTPSIGNQVTWGHGTN